jgi:RNA polymerase sigma factor (sigma-70 family)
VTKDESRGVEDAGERAGISEAERRERLTQLVLRRSKLSPDEAALLHEVFPDIVAAHSDYVLNELRKRGVDEHEAEDLRQEVFLALHNQLLEVGFVSGIKVMLRNLVWGKRFNHARAQKRSPLSIGLPSSTSEPPPRSPFDVERALHFQKVARRLFSQLSPEHQEVIDKVVMRGLTHTEAAAALRIPEGTLKSRLLAAIRALSVLAEPLLPPSERGPL